MMWIFADGTDVSVWWVAAAGAFGTVLSAVVTAVVTLLSTWAANKQKEAELKKAATKDALSEWQEIAERQQTDMDKIMLEMRELREQSKEAQVREMQCQIRVAQQQGEIKLLESTVRRLQRLMGDEPPIVVSSGLIIADTQGIIQVVSPSITPLLHYFPQELKGRSVEVLMPERYKDAHRTALSKIASQQGPWPEKSVVAEALTKEGDEIPVLITLSGWQTACGSWMISAEIRQRHTPGDATIVSGAPSGAPSCRVPPRLTGETI